MFLLWFGFWLALCSFGVETVSLMNDTDSKPKWDKNFDRTFNEIEAVPAGTQAKLTCRAVGSPEPEIRWYREGIVLTNASRRKLDYKYTFKRWSLVFDNALPSDSDTYSCEAFNKLGSVIRDKKLRVVERSRSRPVIDPNDPRNATAVVGTQVEFECKVMSDLNYGILWFFQPTDDTGTPIPKAERRQVTSDVVPIEYLHMDKSFPPQTSKFVILNVTAAHQGVYSCTVGNQFGKSTRSGFLNVVRPNSTEKRVNVTFSTSNVTSDAANLTSFVTPESAKISPSTDVLNIIIIVGVAVIVSAAMCCMAFLVCRKLLRSKLKKNIVETNGKSTESNEIASENHFGGLTFGQKSIVSRQNDAFDDAVAPLLNEFDQWEKDCADLILYEEIGSGVGGIVYRGIFAKKNGTQIEVAVKENNYSNENSLAMMRKELAMFIRVGQHENVLKLIGCCTQTNPISIIFEFCHKGDMKSYLKRVRNDGLPYEKPTCNCFSSSIEMISNEKLIDFALQTARGMKHIADTKCIHRDLAARNVLLTKDNVIKIGDLGLANVLSDEYFYKVNTNRVLPVRWMAPEVLRSEKFTYQNDIWAFGVYLWELFTFGDHPYADEVGATDKTMFELLNKGVRLPQPTNCREDIYMLMRRCWSKEPILRPKFDEIVENLVLIKSSTTSELYLEILDEQGSSTS